jgi:hypothetical protein
MRLAALFTLIALPTVVATASARTWSQDWPVGAHPTLYVETTDAHVYVHRGAAGSVKAHIEYTVNVWGLHTEIREPRIQLEREGDSLTVIARPRSSVAVFGGISERFRIDVTVPPTCDVHVRLWTGDGGIDADGLDGSLVARTGDGHLQVSGRFDRMELHSGDGRVEASIQRGSRLLGPWDFTSGDGGITLRIPRNLQAVLDAATRDGSVRVDLPIDLGDQRRHHVLRGALNGGTIPLRVRTGDGSITLALSE